MTWLLLLALSVLAVILCIAAGCRPERREGEPWEHTTSHRR